MVTFEESMAVTIKAKGAVYVTSRYVDDKWIIRILDESCCLVEVEAIVEPTIIGDARVPEHEPPRPVRMTSKI